MSVNPADLVLGYRINPVALAHGATLDTSQAVDVLVLVASFNRREKTLAALHGLCTQRTSEALSVAVVVYDAGSKDGTGDALIAEFPWVELVRGDPSAYWSRSMQLAQHHGLAACTPRYLLWLNDDTTLYEDALMRTVRVARTFDDRAVITGALCDPEIGLTTYTAMRRSGRRPTQVNRVEPTDSPRPVDTFNGNFTLVPRPVYLAVGSIDGRFGHAYGDIDYGFRVARAGFRSVLAPGYVGSCMRNSLAGTWRDQAVPRPKRVRLLFGPKAMPIRPYLRFLRRHAPARWPVYAAAGYAKAVLLIAGGRSIRGWERVPDEDMSRLATAADRA